jgi:hypothetical protein
VPCSHYTVLSHMAHDHQMHQWSYTWISSCSHRWHWNYREECKIQIREQTAHWRYRAMHLQGVFFPHHTYSSYPIQQPVLGNIGIKCKLPCITRSKFKWSIKLQVLMIKQKTLTENQMYSFVAFFNYISCLCNSDLISWTRWHSHFQWRKKFEQLIG